MFGTRMFGNLCCSTGSTCSLASEVAIVETPRFSLGPVARSEVVIKRRMRISNFERLALLDSH